MVALSEEFAAGLEGIDANLSATSVSFDVSSFTFAGKYHYHLLPLLVALVALLAVYLHSVFVKLLLDLRCTYIMAPF